MNLPVWERVPFTYINSPVGSAELEKIVAAYIPSRQESLTKLIAIKNRIGVEGLDLLWQLLDLNPSRRISAEKALNHQFFDSVRSAFSCNQINNEIKVLVENYEGEIPLSHFQFISDQMHFNEKRLMPAFYFMQQQKYITDNMRSILVDWLVDVSVHFEVMSETLHFAINYIDRTLSKMEVEKSKLQLIGVSCMKIADVFNEKSKEYYRQENASEYSYITADEYTPMEVIQMEKKILNILDFDLYSPTSVSFLKIYNQIF